MEFLKNIHFISFNLYIKLVKYGGIKVVYYVMLYVLYVYN